MKEKKRPTGHRGRNEPILDFANLTDAELAAIPCEEVITSSPREGRQFLRGPLDWADMCRVARLPGKAWAVWLLLHLRWPLVGVEGVTLPNARLAEMGVDRAAKLRALKALEGAGLIRVERQRGCSPRISLVQRRTKKPRLRLVKNKS